MRERKGNDLAGALVAGRRKGKYHGIESMHACTGPQGNTGVTCRPAMMNGPGARAGLGDHGALGSAVLVRLQNNLSCS
jgi:hypothetical protein